MVGARDLGAFNVSNTPQATFTLRRSSGVIGFYFEQGSWFVLFVPF